MEVKKDGNHLDLNNYNHNDVRNNNFVKEKGKNVEETKRSRP
jgi:hypothetical protein